MEGGAEPIHVSRAVGPVVRRRAVTIRLEADAVFTVDDEDTVLAPGALEIDEGRHHLGRGSLASAAGAGHRGATAGGLLMPGLVNCHGHSPMTLVRSAGRRAAPRSLARTKSVWPREANAERRGRLLGDDARRGRAARLRRHDDLRAVPPSGAPWPRPCSTPVSAPSTPSAIFDMPEAGPATPGSRCWRAPASCSTQTDGKEDRLACRLRPARRLHRAARGPAGDRRRGAAP